MGIGRTKPDPDQSLFIEDKIEVPLGKPISSNINDTTLLYNEYPFFLHLEFNFSYFIDLCIFFKCMLYNNYSKTTYCRHHRYNKIVCYHELFSHVHYICL